MLAIAERIKHYGRKPDQIVWHLNAPGHRCNGACDFHPIACSPAEGIVFPGPKQDVPAKLDKPDESWCLDCRTSARTAKEDSPVSDTCTPMTVHVGAEECLDGECDEYFDEAGEPTGIDACTHLTTEQVCEAHTTTDANRAIHAEPWPCQHAAPAASV